MTSLRRVRRFSLIGSVLLVAFGVLVPAAGAENRQRDPIGQDPYVLGQVYRGDFPDPDVIRTAGGLFAFATSTAGLNLPVLGSVDSGSTWRVTGPHGAKVPDALPKVPTWAYGRQIGARRVGVVWAPSVARITGHYVLAYTVRRRGPAKRMCISTAASATVRGPYADHSSGPLVCPARGAIDPQLYREGGHNYLLYKTEDVSIGRPTRIWIRRLTDSGRAFSEPTAHLLLRAQETWEDGVVEAPSMILFHGHRYLFYSGNGWGSPHYATGYAVCPTLTGLCQRQGGGTDPGLLLASDATQVGTGGASAYVDATGHLMLAYHAWDAGATQYPTSTKCRTQPAGCGQRRLHRASLDVAPDGSLTVAARY